MIVYVNASAMLHAIAAGWWFEPDEWGGWWCRALRLNDPLDFFQNEIVDAKGFVTLDEVCVRTPQLTMLYDSVGNNLK